MSVSTMGPNWRRSGERSLHRNATQLRKSLRLPELPQYLLGGPRGAHDAFSEVLYS